MLMANNLVLYLTELVSDVEPVKGQEKTYETYEDEAIGHPTDGNASQVPMKSAVDHKKLLFSVFSILQRLGADERPEVLLSY